MPILHTWRQIDSAAGATAQLVSRDTAVESAAILPRRLGAVIGYGDNVDVLHSDGSSRNLTTQRSGVTAVVLSKDGRLCASTSTDGNVYLWETDGWKLAAHRKFDGWIECLGFTGDGKNLVLVRHFFFPGLPASAVILTGVAELREASTVVPRGSFIPKLYDPGSDLLVLDTPGRPTDTDELRLINVASHAARIVRMPSAPKPGGLGVAVAGGKLLVAACSDDRIRIIACDTGETRVTVEPGALQPISVAAGDSADLFVSAEGTWEGQPSRLVVRSCRTGNPCATLDYPALISRVWFDSDQRIVFGSSLGTVIRWELPKDLKCD